ncbi:aspartate aminotransferase family protein [Hwanghaeella sp.]|uniref:aspartate aminotransferase family protein n=1 Tax=Hwanghaeella sp. TaxID=2605943 RepID=UPI003CCC004D
MTETLETQSVRNYDIEELKRLDMAHHWHPFTDTKALHKEGGARVITRAEGCYLYDGDGHKLLDGMAGLWCVNVGYGRQELAETAYRQMLELPYYNTFFKTATPPAIELSAKVASLLGDNFHHIFYSNSGSEANDTVLRMVRHYWNLKGQPNKKTIISRWNAYHGSTVAGASLGGMKPMHKQADLPIPGITHVMQPHWFQEAEQGETPEDFGKRAAHAIEQRILELGPENVAAFIGEPVQGAGGVVIPPSTYWPEVQKICQKYDLLLIADEVICGFGRTGSWFGHQTLGIKPDLIPMAKGMSSGYLPISAVAVSDKVSETLFEKGGEFYHGYTYSGHPAACAVALRNIEIMEREHLVEKVHNETGPYLAEALATLRDHPLVGETRTLGLLGAVEICKNKETRERFADLGKVGTMCRDHIMERNAISRACGDTMVVSPPLIIEKGQIDDLVAALRGALDDTMADVEKLGL